MTLGGGDVQRRSAAEAVGRRLRRRASELLSGDNQKPSTPTDRNRPWTVCRAVKQVFRLVSGWTGRTAPLRSDRRRK